MEQKPYATCAPGRNRTYDLRFRKPLLYPTELRELDQLQSAVLPDPKRVAQRVSKSTVTVAITVFSMLAVS
jgi:hypothetical protein